MSISLVNGDTNQNSLRGQRDSVSLPSPLSPEAKGLRAGLTTQQVLLEAVEGELSSMEQTDLKKMRLYKIALIILTLVGLAILFVIPVMMIFNISLWIPVVITLGMSLFTGLASTKLRARCQEIRLKYRSLQVYHRHLMSQHPDLRSSTLSKYHIEIPKGGSLKEKLLAKLRPDMSQNVYDGGATLDKNIGLSGEMHSRYQCNALLGVDGVDDAAWQKRLSDVLNAKVELLKNNSAYSTLRALSNSSLQETGVDLPALLPGIDFVDLAKSLMSICGFGNKVGLEIRQTLDQYERTYLHSNTLSSWLLDITPATRLYLSQEQQTVDITLDIFTKLQTHIAKVQLADWLVEFEAWKTDVYALSKDPTLTDLYSKIQAGANKLNTHESIDATRQLMIRNIVDQLKNIISEHESGNVAEADTIKTALQASIKTETKNIRTFLGDKRANAADLSNKVQTELIGYLANLGNLSSLFDKIHRCIQLGKFVRMDIEKAIQKHPDKQRVRILSSINQLLNLVNKDSWGAISPKPVEEILQDKNAIIQDLEKAREKVEGWSEKYNTFKSQKMTLVLMHDFSENYATIESEIDKLKTSHHQAEDVAGFIQGCRTFLDTTYNALGGAAALPTKEDIAAWAEEFKALMGELYSIVPEIQSIGQRIQVEGTTTRSLLWQALASKESSLKTASKKKELELVAAIQSTQPRPQETIDVLLDSGIDHIQAILTEMTHLEQSLSSPDNIAVEEVIRASNQLFSVMHEPRSGKLADLETVLSSYGEQDVPVEVAELGEVAESTAQTVSDAQNVSKSFWETRNNDLSSFLNQVQKIASKWNKGQSLVMFVLGVGMLIASLSLLSLQMVWLPIGLSAAALVLQIIPMVFDHIIEEKTFDVRVASLAKDLLPATKILPSEFNNPDVQRLSRVQDILQLEGFEHSWARGIVRDLDGDPSHKKDDFKKSIQELKSFSKSLDKRIQRRFGTTDLQGVIDRKKASEETVRDPASLTSDQQEATDHLVLQPTDAAAREMILASGQRRLDEITVEIGRLEEEENKIVNHRMRYDNELLSYRQQVAYKNQLQQRLEHARAQFSELEQMLVESRGMADVLSQIVSQIPDQQVDANEIKSRVEALTQLMFKIDDPNASDAIVNEAKQLFDNLVKESAEAGYLQEIQNTLELSSCLGNNDVRLDQHRRDQLARFEVSRARTLEDPSQRTIVGEQELEVRKRALDYLGIGHLSPFLEFSSPIPGKGWSLAQGALGELQCLKQKISDGEEVSTEEYRKAQRLLSSYLRVERNLSPLAYGTLLGDENFVRSTQIIREGKSLQGVVAVNATMGRHHLYSLASQRIDSWIMKNVHKRKNTRLVANLLEHVRANERVDGQNQDLLRDLYQKLLQQPKYVLTRLVKDFQVKALTATQKIQNVKEIEKKYIIASSVVGEKDKMFAQGRTEWERELEALSQTLQELQKRKRALIQEKIALGHTLYSSHL
ncbi:transmembrane protein [Chlamydia abortus]|uniref:hypothetical protein n=1 Tax=Chlamydia abortus TaxID=83555 RepID=UPI000A27F3CA|nr:hypothetical protein [Chlamydia abortus]SGA03933.1 transmembrane protein [Chlamydia abortus]SHD83895.1 transmembrane protein [Chlamydia abortus]